jgi:hypothetical protein
MPRVELAASAVEDLRTLIRTHSLPPDAPARVVRSLRSLERFPLLGPAVGGRWDGLAVTALRRPVEAVGI